MVPAKFYLFFIIKWRASDTPVPWGKVDPMFFDKMLSMLKLTKLWEEHDIAKVILSVLGKNQIKLGTGVHTDMSLAPVNTEVWGN